MLKRSIFLGPLLRRVFLGHIALIAFVTAVTVLPVHHSMEHAQGDLEHRHGPGQQHSHGAKNQEGGGEPWDSSNSPLHDAGSLEHGSILFQAVAGFWIAEAIQWLAPFGFPALQSLLRSRELLNLSQLPRPPPLSIRFK